ncbi:conserved hypothetical protein [Ricinus communis]|uniref:CSC1-like protein ERD4 n=1 Tax=Ricinus communis TaxID=3988 RepID=B9SYI4_RICCO|nr:conserved hypothetical protein [Ricinus communis]
MDFSSFLTSLATSFVIFLVLMFLFTWLSRRPGNAVVYYPNRILKGLEPWEGGSRTRNPFAWIREAMSSTEQDIIDMSGVDTAVYFVFLSTVLSILVLSGIILLPVLLPVAATEKNVTATNSTSEGSFNDLDKLSMGHINEKSSRLWAFLISTYWVSLVTYFMLWKAYMHVSGLRATALMSPEIKPEQFAILVRDIPAVAEGQSRKEQVDSYFKSIYPDTFYRSMVVTETDKVNKIYEELEGYKKKLARAEAIYAQSKELGKPEGSRPTTRIGFLGLIGKEVDSIEYFNEKIKELLPKLEAEQKVTLREKQQPSALKILPFLKPVVDIDAVKTVLEAYLPQLALIIFLALLPSFLMFLSKLEGIPSVSHAVRATSGKYFYFTVLNVFLGVTLSGTLFSAFKKIQKDPNSTVTLLADGLPGNATFFLTFVALKFFVGYGLELSRIVPLIIYHLKRKYLCKTEDELKEAWKPGDFGYATRVPGDMLIITIVLCYSIIAPLIIPFGVVYFGLGWLVLRNQALKVFVPSFESYGRMWPHIHTRILASLLLFQVTMFGYFGVKKFVFAPFLLPLPIITLIFVFVCRKKFYRSFCNPALEVACRGLKEIPNMEQIFRSFIPPSLNSEKIDDDQFEDALSQISRMGSFA